MSRLFVIAVVALGFIVSTSSAQDLDQVGRELSLKAQKIVRDVNFSLSQAKAKAQTDPKAAREMLRSSKLLLEDDEILPERQRRELLRSVNTRLSEINALVAAQVRVQEEAAQQAADRVGRENRNGNDTKTGAQTGPAAAAKGRIGSTQEILAKVDTLRGQREQGRMGVLSGIEASATPFDGVVEYPKYWNAITDRRKQKLDKTEVALLKALNSTMSVDFKGAPFNEVIDYLQEKTGQPIIIDENSLKDLMIESSDPVTFKVNKVTVRTILRKILADRGLAYVIREGTIQVVTAQKAREMVVVRAYPVADLVTPPSGFYTPFAVYNNVNSLINMIQSAVEPSYWAVNGGPGTITFHPGSMSIVIRASAEMHYMFGGTGMLGGR